MIAAALREAARVRRGAMARGEGPSTELNVVPFLDIVMNVLMFVLLTMSADFVGAVEIPRLDRSAVHGTEAAPLLRVFADREGVRVSFRGGWIAPDCQRFGARGVAVASVGASLDVAGLRRCLARMRAVPAWRAELAAQRRIVVSVDEEVPYGVMIEALDAAGSAGPLS